MVKQMLRFALQTAGVVALLAAIAVPSASAATQKKQNTKKQQITKSAASKKVVTTRKSASFVSGIPRKSIIRVSAPPRFSYGQIAGLHGVHDELELKSSVALVIDQDTREVLFRKNEQAVLPIASLTKLMTGVIISGAKLPMDEMITVTQDDVDTEKGSSSRLRVGTALLRG